MTNRKTHRALRLILVLLLATALPALGAGEARPDSTALAAETADTDPVATAGAGPRLHLDRAISLGRAETGPVLAISDAAPAAVAIPSSAAVAAAPAHATALALPATVDGASFQQTQALEEQVKPKKRGFGRWLKKHWYVPALVGAAVAFTVLDDSDDPNEIDD